MKTLLRICCFLMCALAATSVYLLMTDEHVTNQEFAMCSATLFIASLATLFLVRNLEELSR